MIHKILSLNIFLCGYQSCDWGLVLLLDKFVELAFGFSSWFCFSFGWDVGFSFLLFFRSNCFLIFCPFFFYVRGVPPPQPMKRERLDLERTIFKVVVEFSNFFFFLVRDFLFSSIFFFLFFFF